MSFVNERFSYRGIDSETMGVMLVSIDTGMLKRVFGVKKTINREKIRGNDIPIHYNTERQTYNIPITICKVNGNEPWTNEEWIRVSQWLFADDDFHEFVSGDNPDIIYPLQFIEASFNDNYNHEGYIELQAEMQSPYPFMRTSLSTYDLSDNTTSTVIELENKSNVSEYYYPMFELELQGDSTSVNIRNLSVGGEITSFFNLSLGETVNVDNATQQIASSTGKVRVDNFNMRFLRLVTGKNRLEITGKCRITFKCTFPIMI